MSAQDKNGGGALKWMARAGRMSAGYMAGVVALDAAVGASAAVQALLFRSLVDGAVAHDAQAAVRAGVLLVALVACVMLLEAASRYVKERAASSAENRLKDRVLRAAFEGDLQAVQSLHTADWVARLSSDASTVAGSLANLVPNVGSIAARLVAAAAVLFSFDAVLGAIVLAAGAATIAPTGAMRTRFKRLHKDIQAADADVRTFAQEHLESLEVLHSFAREQQALDAADGLLDAHRAARLRRVAAANRFALLRGFLSRGTYALAAFWCAWRIYTGDMTMGTLVATLALVSQMQGPLSGIAGLLPGYYAACASAERLREAEDAAGRCDAFVRCMPQDIGFESFGLDGVGFAYRAEEPGGNAGDAAVQGISFAVGRGQHVGFSGPSGCGKSTAIKLLLCLYPVQAGRRYYTDAQGIHDLQDVARWLFAYVPQENMLLSGTVRQALSFHGQDASGKQGGAQASAADDADMWNALRAACADGFVRRLPGGLDAPLGERGAGLSGGQMQRLAIARAVYSGRPVLLLDEATSALDAQTEAAVLENLFALPGRTVVYATHRAAALDLADAVVDLGAVAGAAKQQDDSATAKEVRHAS